MSEERYLGPAPFATKVFWYPHGVKHEKTEPRIGWVVKGWSQGVADLSILPLTDGAMEFAENSFHASDPRIRDHNGVISSAAKERGFYEFVEEQTSCCSCKDELMELKRLIEELKRQQEECKKKETCSQAPKQTKTTKK